MRALVVVPFILALPLSAQTAPPPLDEQITVAVLPLPEDLRANATVMGYRVADRLEVIREGTNGMRCLALYVTRPDFHVACYHEGLEPFMARGRALRAEGVRGTEIDSVRFREIRAGTLSMPASASLYSLTGDKSGFDPATRTVRGASQLTVLYVPNATSASIGISSRPTRDGPWLMNPGTLKAHVMIQGTMSP
jgi:hypothetical protein